jgi:hypothetical protein
MMRNGGALGNGGAVERSFPHRDDHRIARRQAAVVKLDAAKTGALTQRGAVCAK